MDEWLETFARATFARSADTAHDLKTPLNVAVLNLELLRMRIAGRAPSESAEVDEKVAAYAHSVELELRRMALIFDTFFLLSAPPKSEGAPILVDVSALSAEAAEAVGLAMPRPEPFRAWAHESRIRQALKLFLQGATHVLRCQGVDARAGRDGEPFVLEASGVPSWDPFQLEKVFKFYYSDPAGNPEMSLASARLIVECYGGGLVAVEDRDNVVMLRLSLPPGDR